jgi:hypothetical protein
LGLYQFHKGAYGLEAHDLDRDTAAMPIMPKTNGHSERDFAVPDRLVCYACQIDRDLYVGIDMVKN